MIYIVRALPDQIATYWTRKSYHALVTLVTAALNASTTWTTTTVNVQKVEMARTATLLRPMPLILAAPIRAAHKAFASLQVYNIIILSFLIVFLLKSYNITTSYFVS